MDMANESHWEAVAAAVETEVLASIGRGQRLPTAAELAQRYAVGRTTVTNEVFPHLLGRGVIGRDPQDHRYYVRK
jgi:DNA-binding FadR family transcriptional regulator